MVILTPPRKAKHIIEINPPVRYPQYLNIILYIRRRFFTAILLVYSSGGGFVFQRLCGQNQWSGWVLIAWESTSVNSWVVLRWSLSLFCVTWGNIGFSILSKRVIMNLTEVMQWPELKKIYTIGDDQNTSWLVNPKYILILFSLFHYVRDGNC